MNPATVKVDPIYHRRGSRYPWRFTVHYGNHTQTHIYPTRQEAAKEHARITAQTRGAKFDGITDDTAAWQAALDGEGMGATTEPHR